MKYLVFVVLLSSCCRPAAANIPKSSYAMSCEEVASVFGDDVARCENKEVICYHVSGYQAVAVWCTPKKAE